MTSQYTDRRSIRLYGYDYSQAGLYFVTLCAQNRICLFGQIEEGGIILNRVGQMVEECWKNIPKHFPNVDLHEYIVMPNHLHGILEIGSNVGANNYSPENRNEQRFRSPSKTLGSIIRGFKIGVTKWYKQNYIGSNDYSPLPTRNSIWQRNYYEHIIRDEKDYSNISEYIVNNPFSWKTDFYYNK